MKSVFQMAQKDITEYVHEQEKLYLNKEWNEFGGWDVWVCSWIHIYTKETIRLNRVLGLHKINKNGIR